MSETPTPPPAAAPLAENEENLYLTLSHAGIILFGFLPPLIFWLIGKDRSARVDAEGKEALNFGILVSIGYVVSSFLMAILIGFLTWAAVFILTLIWCIPAAMKANKGETYRYPFNWRIIK